MMKFSNARPPNPFRVGLWRHILFSKKSSGVCIVMHHGAMDFCKRCQLIFEAQPSTGPYGPRGPETRPQPLRVYYKLYTFVKFHPLLLDYIGNTRDLFQIFLDPPVSIIIDHGASSLSQFHHLGFHQTIHNPCMYNIMDPPDEPTEEESSPIWANLGQHSNSKMPRNNKWKRRKDVNDRG